MITSLTDYIEASAFERAAIATVYRLVNPAATRAGYDLRTDTATIGLTDNIGTQARDELVRELRPLLFGAAWKVLDLLVEYGMNTGDQSREWRINEKQSRARDAALLPLSGDPTIWSRVAATYASTVEHRHSLVHRSFVLTATGEMSQMHDRSGNAVRDLSVGEQDAFCRVAQRVSMIMIAQHYSLRERLDLVASLDALANHHGQSVIGGGAPESLPLVMRVDASHITGTCWVVDTDAAATVAASVFPGRAYYDIEINFPGAGIAPLVGRLEEAPRDSRLQLDLANLPMWIDP